MKIFYSPKCLEYWRLSHPESPYRIRNTYELLEKKFGNVFSAPSECDEEDILLAHSMDLLQRLKNSNEMFFDSDTANLPDIFSYAKLAAGSAINAMMNCEKEFSFSLMRPPGHHAERKNIMGFCYLNNIAIAVAKALKNFRKIAIIDIDGHWGNGTQDIFKDNFNVLFLSLHQKGAYPSSPMHSNNCINIDIPAGTGGDEYISALEEGLKSIEKFEPQLIAVSAGFDAYKEDPLLQLELETKDYKTIGKKIKNIRKPTFAVMEGGYSDGVQNCVHEFIKGIK